MKRLPITSAAFASAVLLTLLALAGCSALSPPPPTPTPTNTPPPASSTPSPTSTPTLEPTATETAVPATPTEGGFILALPSGEPVSEWQGISIMPGALQGEEGDGGYSFTIQAARDEIEDYYAAELEGLGWVLLRAEDRGSVNALMLFTRGTEVLSVSILSVDPDESLWYVMLLGR